ncbi:hypothetical protein FN846DRAFT_973342 [Sphaerosporella brunnea]|uniref:Uncharacterized protein n=1 Tax=Sphaerosporella brunnea TaxID=1250544 RepID=A0A5J5EIV7_9PEZI|nr:hypothetical protein FN846DRAFT_973342 [Sphaerosporella brunnea]
MFVFFFFCFFLPCVFFFLFLNYKGSYEFRLFSLFSFFFFFLDERSIHHHHHYYYLVTYFLLLHLCSEIFLFFF